MEEGIRYLKNAIKKNAGRVEEERRTYIAGVKKSPLHRHFRSHRNRDHVKNSRGLLAPGVLDPRIRFRCFPSYFFLYRSCCSRDVSRNIRIQRACVSKARGKNKNQAASAQTSTRNSAPPTAPRPQKHTKCYPVTFRS